MKTHKTKDGRVIPINTLSDSHLKNILRKQRQLAKEGITVCQGGGSCPDDFWYDEYKIYEQEALEHLNYQDYLQEYQKRKL